MTRYFSNWHLRVLPEFKNIVHIKKKKLSFIKTKVKFLFVPNSQPFSKKALVFYGNKFLRGEGDNIFFHLRWVCTPLESDHLKKKNSILFPDFFCYRLFSALFSFFCFHTNKQPVTTLSSHVMQQISEIRINWPSVIFQQISHGSPEQERQE